jgi:hypothetical protein
MTPDELGLFVDDRVQPLAQVSARTYVGQPLVGRDGERRGIHHLVHEQDLERVDRRTRS